MEYSQILIIALLIEAIWENCKSIWQKGKVSIDMIGSLLMSILVCILTKSDIFALVGVEISIEYIAFVLTGIVVSRGANFVHDLFNKLKGEK
jgi:hypothetical protein